MGLLETAAALKATWTAFCEALVFPRCCIHCHERIARPCGRNVRGASVLVGGKVEHIHGFPVRRAWCEACDTSWQVRPPGLSANRHYQLDVVAEALTAYLYRGDTPSQIARELGQELAVLVGLSTWNMRLARGFALEPLPEVRPAQQLRRPRVDDRVPACWPRDPVVAKLLDGLDWAELLGTAQWAGWRYDAGELRCPDDRPLTLTTVRKAERSEGHTGIIFRRPKGGCEACEARDDCLRSGRPEASKHAELSIPTEVAQPLRERLARVRRRRRGSSGPPEPGPQVVSDSLFLPARARQAYDACFLRASLRVEVEVPEAPPLLELLAQDVGDRQRRRKTWAQNAARYGLPEAAEVRVSLEAGDALRAALGHSPRHADQAVVSR